MSSKFLYNSTHEMGELFFYAKFDEVPPEEQGIRLHAGDLERWQIQRRERLGRA